VITVIQNAFEGRGTDNEPQRNANNGNGNESIDAEDI